MVARCEQALRNAGLLTFHEIKSHRDGHKESRTPCVRGLNLATLQTGWRSIGVMLNSPFNASLVIRSCAIHFLRPSLRDLVYMIIAILGFRRPACRQGYTPGYHTVVPLGLFFRLHLKSRVHVSQKIQYLKSFASPP